MAWCKLEDTFRGHWKFTRLATELGVRPAEARGLVAGLLSWAVSHAPDGDLSQLDETEIANAADWSGSASDFVRAMSSERVGLLERKKHGLVIHDFMERAESRKVASRKAKEREKKRREKDVSRDKAATVTDTTAFVSPGEERRREEKRGEDLFPVAPSAAGEPTPIGQVRGAWLAAYSAKYPDAKPYPWGARESGQAKNLLKSVPLAEVLDLVPRFFSWPNARAIRAGHPFGTGGDCFVLKHIELRADLADIGRRGEAAMVDVAIRKAEKAVSGETSAKDEASELAQALMALVARRGRTWSSTCRYEGHETAEAGVAAELGQQAADVVKRSGGWDAFCREWGSKQGDATSRAQLRGLCEAAQARPGSTSCMLAMGRSPLKLEGS